MRGGPHPNTNEDNKQEMVVRHLLIRDAVVRSYPKPHVVYIKYDVFIIHARTVILSIFMISYLFIFDTLIFFYFLTILW